jgi:hypothetical protein
MFNKGPDQFNRGKASAKPEQPGPMMEGDFEVFFAGEQKRYRCNQFWSTGARCWYDTYDKEELLRHVSQPHSETGKRAKPPKRRTVASPILGPDGNQIVRDVNEARFREEE